MAALVSYLNLLVVWVGVDTSGGIGVSPPDANGNGGGGGHMYSSDGTKQYCDGCGAVKAIRAAVPKPTSFRVARPLERFFGHIKGSFAPLAGGARLYMVLVEDHSNVGSVLFRRDKNGATVTGAFRGFFTAIKPLIAVNGPVDSMRTDNGLEFVNRRFRQHAGRAGHQAGVHARRVCET